MTKHLEDTNLADENIHLEDITLKSFLPLLAKRFIYFVLKSVGSRTMIWANVQYLTSIFLMYVFATNNLSNDVMKYILYFYISQSVIVLTLFGIVKFEKVKTELRLGK